MLKDIVDRYELEGVASVDKTIKWTGPGVWNRVIKQYRRRGEMAGMVVFSQDAFACTGEYAAGLACNPQYELVRHEFRGSWKSLNMCEKENNPLCLKLHQEGKP